MLLVNSGHTEPYAGLGNIKIKGLSLSPVYLAVRPTPVQNTSYPHVSQALKEAASRWTGVLRSTSDYEAGRVYLPRDKNSSTCLRCSCCRCSAGNASSTPYLEVEPVCPTFHRVWQRRVCTAASYMFVIRSPGRIPRTPHTTSATPTSDEDTKERRRSSRCQKYMTFLQQPSKSVDTILGKDELQTGGLQLSLVKLWHRVTSMSKTPSLPAPAKGEQDPTRRSEVVRSATSTAAA